jgi:excisionase family DNA binding protein
VQKPVSTVPSQVITAPELAQQLRVSNETARRLLEAGEFPNAFKLASTGKSRGSRWRIPTTDVEAFIARQVQRPLAAAS